MRKFENEYLQPLVEGKYRTKRADVDIRSLKKKAIHLVFEEGTAANIDDETLDAIRRMKLRWCNRPSGQQVPLSPCRRVGDCV